MPAQPICPVFGICSGCSYQDKTYDEELQEKQSLLLQELSNFLTHLKIDLTYLIHPILKSPQEYHTRHRIDLSLRKLRGGHYILGFNDREHKQLIDIESCPIAHKAISDQFPALKQTIIQTCPPDYRNANITIKTGDDGRVFWGGIGRRSLTMKPEDYLWTSIHGQKIFYALDTFFQANLSILPLVIDRIAQLLGPHKHPFFLDLYAGVGLFGLSLSDHFEKVILIEDNPASHRLSEHNIKHRKLPHVHSLCQPVEKALPSLLAMLPPSGTIAFIDPPRKGLSNEVRGLLGTCTHIEKLCYLSCNPTSLGQDLVSLLQSGWKLTGIHPFDFFPKTSHLETLAVLERHA